MVAMPGMRTFAVSPRRGATCVSFSEDGLFVGNVPLLQKRIAARDLATWGVRSIAEINNELTACYRLPVDISSKANALALVANALNRGDWATAAIAAVQMRLPNPPSSNVQSESPAETMRRAVELSRSGLLKFWDPAKHPRAGVPPNPGWFAPVDGGAEAELVPAAMRSRPWEKPFILEGGEGGGVPRGQLELPFPDGLPRFRGSSEPPGTAPPEPTPKSGTPTDPSSKLPFMDESLPQLVPYGGGKTYGIFQPPGEPAIVLESGSQGPAAEMPPGSLGFDGVTKLHVEGHAAALMWQQGIEDATLTINNPEICDSCLSLLPRMLPPGATLRVILPGGRIIEFTGIPR
jgi:hypothetical protein